MFATTAGHVPLPQSPSKTPEESQQLWSQPPQPLTHQRLLTTYHGCATPCYRRCGVA